MSETKVNAARPYRPAEVEHKVYRRWERAGVFTPAAKPRRGRKPFVIVIPPPNITGSLHMGHALQDTLMDVLTRYHRMLGDDTLWVPGTDHAGIATQNVVEKELRKEGKTRRDLGRELFVARVWEWKQRFGGIIDDQLRRLGASCDWTRYHFTLDPSYARAVQEAFIHYAREGLIYRGERIVNWCPRCASAISDLEVEHQEEETTLYTIRYGPFQLATVRPETKFGDTGVAVHPGDARYRQYVGKEIEIETVLGPATLRVVADDAVDPHFGTGVVKVTPAHDFTDFEIGQRHGLPPRKVITEDGRMNELTGPFAGMPVLEARKAVVEALRAKGLLVQEEPYRHTLAVCERCGTTVEPLISKQWFLKMTDLARPAIAVVEKQLITFHPARWRQAYLDWLRGVRDWCISRQLWWGHRIPAWYCQAGKSQIPNPKSQTDGRSSHSEAHVVFSVAKPRACPECGGREFVQDPDVLDTWFSSALWPFAVFGWPEATADLRRFYPTSVLTTAPEILSLWVARMVFSGLEFLDQKRYLPARRYGKRTPVLRIPFRDVIVHPTVLTLAGKRMSKSKGTGVDPLDLIERYGADATRFGLLLQLREDQQALRFDGHAIRAARNFVNKVWHIGKYVEAVGGRQSAGGTRRPTSNKLPATSYDRWILWHLAEATRNVTRALELYRFGHAARLLHAFAWDQFADWYIEASKVPGLTTPAVARAVFLQTLTLLHPFTPFLTEHLWGRWKQQGFLATVPWPTAARSRPDAAVRKVQDFHQAVRDIRSLRHVLGLPPTAELPARVAVPEEFRPLLARWARVRLHAEAQQWVPVAGSGNAIQLPAAFLRILKLSDKLRAEEAGRERLSRECATFRERIAGMEGKASAEALERQRALLAEKERARDDAQRRVDVLAGFIR